jgi:hypothetical protein
VEERPVRPQTHKQRKHKLWFILRYAYKVPSDVLDQIDFEAYADPTLEFQENLKVLIDAYPALRQYMPKDYQTLAEKYERQWYNYLYEVLLGAYEGDPEYIELMETMGFTDVREFAKKPLREGVITKEEFEELFPPPEVKARITPEEEEVKLREIKVKRTEQAKLTDKIQEEIEEEKKTMEEPEVYIPEEVRKFCDMLKLEIVGKPEYKRLAGFTYDAWVIPVRDEGTGLTVKIIKGHPVTAMHLYKIIRIVNKEHNTVNVLTFRKDYEVVEPKIPTLTQVRKASEEAKKAVEKVRPMPKPKPAPKVNWRAVRGFVRYGLTSIPQWERAVELKKPYVLWSRLIVFSSKCKMAMKELEKAEDIKEELERKAAGEKVLTDKDIEELWDEFARILKDVGIDPERYRERFNAVIDPYMPYDDNLFVVTDEARKIIAEEVLRTEKFHTTIPVKKFSWKYIGWGLGAIKVRLTDLEVAVSDRDAIRGYSLLKSLCETTDTLISMLEQLPEIQVLKRVTKV